MKDLQCFAVTEPSGAGAAKRFAAAAAHSLGFDEVAQGHVGIIAMELATNLYRHAGGGELLVRSVSCDDVPGVELVAVDRGAGLRDPAAALRDGYSTAGSLGTGLGAVRRLSSQFDLYAPPGRGTVVFSRVWARPRVTCPAWRRFSVGAVCVPLVGESVSGDSWAVQQEGERVLSLVVDGLGHGKPAAVAAAAAVEMFRRHPTDSPLALVSALDAALRRSRGAAVAVAEVLPEAGVVNYAGLGNICARLVTPDGSVHLIGDDGIAGAGTRRAHLRSYAFPARTLLVQHTDGVSANWKAGEYEGLWGHHPVVIAAVLYRDRGRRRDDAAVVVTVPQEISS